MSVSLKAMDKSAFSAYKKQAIPAYAKDNVNAGRWAESDALARSEKEFERLLPDGVNSQDNYFFDIIENKQEQNVGFVWVKIEHHFNTKSAFIYDIEIAEAYRQQGYAKAGLSDIEKVVTDLGATRLGLHVFNNNAAAMALYKSIGYQMVSHNMNKVLHPE